MKTTILKVLRNRSVGLRLATTACLLAVTACGNGSETDPDRATEDAGAVTTLVTGLNAPWGLAFLPDGDALFTERDTHRLRRVDDDGGVSTVQTIPDVESGGEGGLLGIAVSPEYEQDDTVFVYYTTASDNRIARLRLGERPEPIVTGIPAANVHNGGRLAFGPDGYLYAGTGDGGQQSDSQDTDSLAGKILCMTTDGAPAPGNPFDSLVYSYGHRNVQGLAFDDAGRLYASEFGQNQFDELNRIEPGGNYGWPEVEGSSEEADYVSPLVTWPPSQASPSGIAIAGDTVAVACLRGERLWLVTLDGSGGVSGDPRTALRGQFGRLRDVVVAPDDSLWVLTSETDGRGSPGGEDDRIVRFTPTPSGDATAATSTAPR